MIIPPMDLQQQVIDQLKIDIRICENHFNRHFELPNVVYTKQGSTAGTANYSTNTINLNPILFSENIEAFFKRTIPHELAHLIKFTVYGEERTRNGKRSNHGKSWKYIMKLLNADPARCHSYDTSSVQYNSNKFDYTCECCGQSIQLGTKRHNKQINSNNPLGVYHITGHKINNKPAKLIWQQNNILAERPNK